MAIGFDIPLVPREAKGGIGYLDEKEVIVGIGLQVEDFDMEIFDRAEAGDGHTPDGLRQTGGGAGGDLHIKEGGSVLGGGGLCCQPQYPEAGGQAEGQAEAFSAFAFPPGLRGGIVALRAFMMVSSYCAWLFPGAAACAAPPGY